MKTYAQIENLLKDVRWEIPPEVDRRILSDGWRVLADVSTSAQTITGKHLLPTGSRVTVDRVRE